MRRLDAFLPKARVYGRDRNFVSQGHGAVSRLSPLLRHRLLLEEEVANAAMEAHGFGRVEKFVQEVYWRRYWKAWLSLRPDVWRETCGFPGPASDADEGKRALAAMAGDSGNAVIDHFVRELLETGYLHNHARMWFAAWWVHDAGLPWQWGAAFFMSHLLDGDPASNTLSWRWVAGLQTPGKTYLVRRANLEKYLDHEILVRVRGCLPKFESPTPRLPERVIKPEITQWVLQKEQYELGVRTGIWVHEEDLRPECSPLASLASPNAVLVTGHSEGWGRHGYSERRIDWLEGALADTACRVASHWKCLVRFEVPGDLGSRLAAWAVEEGIEQVVALRPEPGPLDDDMARVTQLLGEVGVRLVLLDRPEDLTLRPLAKRGFFAFWKDVLSKIARETNLQGEFKFTG